MDSWGSKIYCVYSPGCPTACMVYEQVKIFKNLL
jgi:hypothetical protein